MTTQLETMAGHLIRRLHQRSTNLFQRMAQAEGIDLTQVQFAALETLSAHPGLDQAQLAQMIAYDRATIGGVVDRLERKGLLRREVNPQDRRARILHITPEGQEIIDALRPAVVAVQDEILQGLSPDERELVLSAMRRALAL